MIREDLLITSWPIIWWDELDSTSLEAQRWAQSGEIGPVWLAAKVQTAGKGRLGRKWISETGNLYTTALLPLEAMERQVSTLSLTVGLAVRDAVIELTQGRVIPGLKWPNDVRVDGAKLCGILLETGRTNAKGYWLSVGIGLNINFAPQIPDYKTVSLSALCSDTHISPEAALLQIDVSLRKRIHQHQTAGLHSIIRDWEAATDQWEQTYTTNVGPKRISGTFAGLDSSGELLLRTAEGVMERVTAGELVPVEERTVHAARD